jgi:hypothetical protein
VTNDFRYGQGDSASRDRFFVLHDKGQKPSQVCTHPTSEYGFMRLDNLQHRSVNSPCVKAGGLSLDLMDKVGVGSKEGLYFSAAAQQSQLFVGE